MFSCSLLNAQFYDIEPLPRISGGGYITGIIYHPTVDNLIYIRTDVGGAYRWKESTKEWIQLFDFLDPTNESWKNIDAIAVTEDDTNVIWAAVGSSLSSSSQVLKSTDRGASWNSTNFPDPIGFEANQRDVRYTGERLGIDPNNKNYVYAGTKTSGLYKTENGGNSWINMSDIPEGSVPSRFTNGSVVGIREIAFDKKQTIGSGSNLRTKVIYAGAYEDGVYQSTNGGGSFTKMPGSPETPREITVANDGSLWVTTEYPIGGRPEPAANATNGPGYRGGRVYHFTNGIWVDKTPEAFDGPNDQGQPGGKPVRRPYGAIDVYAGDDNRVIVMLQVNFNGGNFIYRTDNASSPTPNWVKTNRLPGDNVNKIEPDWYPFFYFATGPASVQFNPTNFNEVWFGDGRSVYTSSNIYVGSNDNEDEVQDLVVWKAEAKNIGELVMSTIITPPSGAELFTGAADVDGFRHADITQEPSDKIDNFRWGTSGYAYQHDDPNIMLRYASIGFGGDQGADLFKSNDNGVTWDVVSGYPQNNDTMISGEVAISTGDPNNWVVMPTAKEIAGAIPLYYTKDGGNTFFETTPLFTPSLKDFDYFVNQTTLMADKVTPGVFYLFDKRRGDFYRSDDGGENFNLVSTGYFANRDAEWCGRPDLPECKSYFKARVHLEPKPGVAGELWLSLDREGLFRSVDGGANWTKIPQFQRCEGVSFGKGSGSYPQSLELYAMNRTPTERQLLVSYDNGTNWRRCDPTTFNFGFDIVKISASKQERGKVFIATGGRSTFTATRTGNPPPAVFQPAADFTFVNDQQIDRKIDFDASSSFNPDGGTLTYSWDFGDGTSGSGATVSKTYSNFGAYQVTLTVTNASNESNSITKQVIANSKPIITITSPQDRSVFAPGQMVTIQVDVQDADGVDDIKRVILWDGTTFDWFSNPIGQDQEAPFQFDVVVREGTNKFVFQAQDNQGANPFTQVFTLLGTSGLPDDYYYGVNCGGDTYTDADGYFYNADEAFVGSTSTFSTGDDIAGTTDDVLYQTERNGAPQTRYRIPVVNGNYDVVLKFAEIGITQSNFRVFDVDVEGTIVANDLDVFAQVGHDVAYDITVPNVIVNDGLIDITMSQVLRFTKINAILIKSGGSSGPVCDIPDGLGASNITASSVDLDWNDIAEAANYDLRYRVQGANNWISNNNVSSSSASLSGLNINTTYEWQVRTSCDSSDSSYSSTETFTTLNVSVPLVGVYFLKNQNSGLRLTNGGTGVGVDYVQGSATATGEDFKFELISAGEDDTYYIENIVTNYRLSIDEGGTVLRGKIESYDGNEDRAKWIITPVPRVNDAGYYFVKNKLSTDTKPLRMRNDGCRKNIGSKTEVVTGTGGCTKWMLETTTPGGGPVTCDAPSSLNTSGITETTATLAWDASASATNYDVRYRVNGMSTWANSNNINTTSTTLSGLSASTEYQWQVRTSCGSDNSNYASGNNFTTSASTGGGSSFTIAVVEDSYVSAGSNANANYGGENKIVIKNSGATSQFTREGLFKFDLAGVSNVTSATLRLYVTKTATGASHECLLSNDDSWSESSVTWNTKPTEASSISTQTVPPVGSWIEYDVTSQVASQASGDGMATFIIKEPSGNKFIWYSSKEGSNAPELTVEGNCDSCNQKSAFLENKNKDGQGIQIYPNPFKKGALNISSGIMIEDISVIDITGRVIFERSFNKNQILLSKEELPISGLVIIKINTGKQINYKRLLIE